MGTRQRRSRTSLQHRRVAALGRSPTRPLSSTREAPVQAPRMMEPAPVSQLARARATPRNSNWRGSLATVCGIHGETEKAWTDSPGPVTGPMGNQGPPADLALEHQPPGHPPVADRQRRTDREERCRTRAASEDTTEATDQRRKGNDPPVPRRSVEPVGHPAAGWTSPHPPEHPLECGGERCRVERQKDEAQRSGGLANVTRGDERPGYEGHAPADELVLPDPFPDPRGDGVPDPAPQGVGGQLSQLGPAGFRQTPSSRRWDAADPQGA